MSTNKRKVRRAKDFIELGRNAKVRIATYQDQIDQKDQTISKLRGFNY